MPRESSIAHLLRFATRAHTQFKITAIYMRAQASHAASSSFFMSMTIVCFSAAVILPAGENVAFAAGLEAGIVSSTSTSSSAAFSSALAAFDGVGLGWRVRGIRVQGFRAPRLQHALSRQLLRQQRELAPPP